MRRVPESEEIYERIGRNVAAKRREAGLSQTELAECCDLARGSIVNIESGKQRATLHTLSSIADALKVDMRSLLPSSEENPSETWEILSLMSKAISSLQGKAPYARENTSAARKAAAAWEAAAAAREAAAAARKGQEDTLQPGLENAGDEVKGEVPAGLAVGAGSVLASAVAHKLIQRMIPKDSSREDDAPSPIPNERLEELQKQAEDLVREAGITTIPVPVEAVAKHLGIEVDEADLGEECSGMLVRHGDSAVIGVHAGHHEHRQRFTIAHEIAHYILHSEEAYIDEHLHIDLRSNKPGSATKQEEDEANRFAGALLMPADQVRKAFAEQRVDPSRDDEIPEMAKRFKVSVQAMTKRLMHLDLISAD